MANPFDGLFGLRLPTTGTTIPTIPGTSIPLDPATISTIYNVARDFFSSNGEVDTTGGFEDADMDGIPDILEGGADCDQIRIAEEQIKAAKKRQLECLGVKPRKSRRKRALTKGDKEDVIFVNSLQGLSQKDKAGIITSMLLAR